MSEGKKQKSVSDAARPENTSVGETLRAARAAKNLSIEDVSSSIHIRSVQLRAIEENNLEALPGMTYAVGFVRSYANFLGLNGVEITHRFKAEHGQMPAHAKLSFPEPLAESRLPNPMVIGISAFLAIALLIGWAAYSNKHDSAASIAEQIPPAPIVSEESVTSEGPAATAVIPLPESAVIASAAPVEAAVTPASSPATEIAAPHAAEPAPVQPPAEEKKTEEKKVEEKAAEDETDKPAKTKPDPDADKKKTDENTVINVTRGKSRVTLRAKQASWIEITDSSRDTVYRKVLRAGEDYFVPDQPGLSLVTANAGGVEVLVDGQAVSALGGAGEIVRGVSLDPSSLKKRKPQPRYN